MKLTQDIFTDIGGHKNTLQFTVDVLNALNLIDKSWGIKQITIVANPLKYVNATGGQANFQFGYLFT